MPARVSAVARSSARSAAISHVSAICLDRRRRRPSAGRAMAAEDARASRRARRRTPPAASASATASRRSGGDTRPRTGRNGRKPQRSATSMTLAPADALQQLAPRRVRSRCRGARRGASCRERSRNCRCSVRAETPATAASSVTRQLCPTLACIASSARRTPRGSGDSPTKCSGSAIIPANSKVQAHSPLE